MSWCAPRTPGFKIGLGACLALSVLLACTLVSLVGCGSADRSLVLVTVSGLRPDKASPELTPQWAALAGTGRRLEGLRTPSPQTVPALAALMAGEAPDRLGARFGDLTHLPADVKTLAERLRERGYKTTAMVGEGRIARITGLGRGFDEFTSPSGPLRQAVLLDERERLRPRQSGWWSARDLAEVAGRHLREQTLEDRFFLWVHVGDLSQLGAVEDPQQAYRALLGQVDALVGDLQDALDTYGLADRVVLAATSLHGMSLGDGGEIGSGLSLDGPVIEIPAFVRGPGVEQAASGRGGAGSGPRGLAELGNHLLGILGLEDRPKQAGGPFFAETRLPYRQYGWPPLALVANERGELSVGETILWKPSGEAPAIEGPEAWDAAPQELRERLAEAGHGPAGASVEGVSPDLKKRVLRSVAQAHRLIDEGRGEEAVEALDDAIALAPEALGLRHAFLMAYTALPQPERRKRALRELRADSLETLQSLSAGDLPRTIDFARDLVRLGRCDQAMAELSRGENLIELPGERLAFASVEASCDAYEAAVARIEAVIEEGGRPAPALQEWRGDLLAMAGNAFRAKQAYEEVLATTQGSSAQLLAKLGDQLVELGEYEEALQKYAQATRLDDGYRYPHARAAEVLLEQGKAGAAAHATVLSVPETGKPVIDALHKARALRRKGLHRAALLEIQKAFEQSPGDIRLQLARVRILREQGELEQARGELAALEQQAPNDPRVLIERARVEAAAGDGQAAIAYLNRAEPHAGPVESRMVRSDPVFLKSGSDALARRAASFEGELAPAQAGGEDGDR
jgi:tetratricopeptide (TPR) repeat protein